MTRLSSASNHIQTHTHKHTQRQKKKLIVKRDYQIYTIKLQKEKEDDDE